MKRLLPMFPSMILMDSYLKFRSFLYFEFSVFGVREWSSFIHLHIAAPIFPAPFIEETAFIPLYIFPTLLKIIWL